MVHGDVHAVILAVIMQCWVSPPPNTHTLVSVDLKHHVYSLTHLDSNALSISQSQGHPKTKIHRWKPIHIENSYLYLHPSQLHERSQPRKGPPPPLPIFILVVTATLLPNTPFPLRSQPPRRLALSKSNEP